MSESQPRTCYHCGSTDLRLEIPPDFPEFEVCRRCGRNQNDADDSMRSERVPREWKPGDVALVFLGEDGWHRAMRTGIPGNMGWELASPTSKRWSSDNTLNLRNDLIRPLVVIDPDNRQQVERLVDALRTIDPDTGGFVLRLQSALRKYADPKPPKPEEPTGWLAAVEDRGGNRWAIAGGPTDGDRRWYSPDLNTTRAYVDIDAVRVISEGVTE